MSERLSNQSFNLVDWKLRAHINGAPPQNLEQVLRELELPQASDEDRRVIGMLDAGEIPEILHPTYLCRGLRVDRPRFAAHAIAWLAEDPDSTCSQLDELAFCAGMSRFGGELWLIQPDVVLSCFDPRFAKAYLAELDSAFEDAPPFEAFAGIQAVTRAMGGLGDDDQPMDQTYDPATAAELAAALSELPAEGLTVQPRLRFLVERIMPDLGAVEQLAQDALARMRALYARARDGGLGVDVYWHSNP
jgi:hypothetical protein